jgi:hypothetical protein
MTTAAAYSMDRDLPDPTEQVLLLSRNMSYVLCSLNKLLQYSHLSAIFTINYPEIHLCIMPQMNKNAAAVA